MKKSNKFSPEVRERAVRMVLEHRGYISPVEAEENYYQKLAEMTAVEIHLKPTSLHGNRSGSASDFLFLFGYAYFGDRDH